MVSKHSFLGRIFSGFILGGFVYVITRLRVEPTLFSLIVIALSLGIIADTTGRFFSGKNDWKILIAAAVIVLADIIFFVVVPESPI